MKPRWLLAAVLFAATSAVVGVIWDISWHRTIGRDRFLTPAHIAIYLSGVVAGLACGWHVLRTTFGRDAEARAASVPYWGFRGPLGAWLCIWGAIAMITSAPFDDWWHNAYGLDVKVLSPPHVLLALGFVAIEIGALVLAVAAQNRAGAERAGGYAWAAVYAGGILVANNAIMAFEQVAFPNSAHNALYYQVSAGIFPLILLATARAARLKWAATMAAATYMIVHLVMIWVLQLFPAQPMLAPIYNPVTTMVPPPFPLLLVVPALAVDLVRQRMEGRNAWLQAAVLGAVFLAVLFPVQWFFSEFLLSPAARNGLFGADQWNYNSRLGPWRYEFWDVDVSPITAAALGLALVIAVASSRLGLAWGAWMARVRR